MRKIVILIVCLVVAAGAYMYYGRADEGVTVKIGSKNFTESVLVSEIFAQALEAEGIKVERKQALGGTDIIQAAMLADEVNLYPEYTSTALLTVLKESADFDPQSAYAKVKSGYKEKFGFVLLDMTSINNSQGLAITKEAADRYGVVTLTDLSRAAPSLRLCATPEFEERNDGLAGLKKRLGGFEFASVKVFDKGIKYAVLRNGEADVNVCFTTDADLSQGDIVAVEDDIRFWPPYNLVPVMRGDLLEKNPKVAEIINRVCAVLDTPTIQALNATVDIEQKEQREVAKGFLTDKGLIN